MVLDKLKYDGNTTSVTRLSRRTYSTTVFNLVASRQSGSNMLCLPEDKEKLYGAVVFVGCKINTFEICLDLIWVNVLGMAEKYIHLYLLIFTTLKMWLRFFFFFLPTSPDPPLPIDFKCETHDLRSAVCQWGKGRNTHLYGSQRGTRYFVNNRYAVSLTKGNSRTVQSLIHRKHLQVLEYMDITGNLYLYFSNNPTSVQTCPNRMLDVSFLPPKAFYPVWAQKWFVQ